MPKGLRSVLPAVIGLMLVITMWLPACSESAPAALSPKVEEFTLENGLEVVVIPNHRVPAVSHMIWFRIGSADEVAGAKGLAHYLEHMLFKGTEKLKVGEYSRLMARHGGEHNAFTSFDYTGYYVNIAKEHLPLVMETEADRWVNLKVDDAEFEKERAVIIEERSMRVDNQPHVLLNEQMRAALFLNHPYHYPVIGWRHEMATLSKDQVFAMYRRYYRPNNAVLVLSGDITKEEAQTLAQKYYGHLPKGELMERHWPDEPQPVAERRMVLRDAKVEQPRFVRFYMAPSYVYGEKAHAIPLSLFEQVMGGTETSRLYQELVVKQKLATGISLSYQAMARGPGMVAISATPQDGVDLPQLEAAIDKALAQSLATPFTTEELARAKTLSKASILYAQDGIENMAYVMGQLKMLGLGADFLHSWTEKVDAVTAEQVTEAGRFVLKREASVTGYLLPSDAAETAGGQEP